MEIVGIGCGPFGGLRHIVNAPCSEPAHKRWESDVDPSGD